MPLFLIILVTLTTSKLQCVGIFVPLFKIIETEDEENNRNSVGSCRNRSL